jgi:hypothetical protein
MSTDADQLSKLWEDLAAPSAKVFMQALRAQGIQVRASDVREFIASKSERQILQPGNRFTGKIAAFDKHDRWAADIISYVSRPVKQAGKEWKYILIVQDMFSRYIWTTPLVSVAETAEAFERTVKRVAPRALVVDRGVEFRAAKFQAVCVKYDVTLEYKETQDGNGPTSRLDAAIGQFKRLSARLQELGKGKTWLDVVYKATNAFNSSHHGATDAPPNAMSDSVILEQRKENAANAAHNDRQIRARKAKLKDLGGFRTLNPKKRGLRRRADAETWSRRIHKVVSFPMASRVVNEDGVEFATKRVLAVALDSTTLEEKNTVEDKLRPYAEEMRELLPEGEAAFAARIQESLTRPGLEAALRGAKLTTAAFIDLFPDILTRNGRRISAA